MNRELFEREVHSESVVVAFVSPKRFGLHLVTCSKKTLHIICRDNPA
jgi:hypothetical protein